MNLDFIKQETSWLRSTGDINLILREIFFFFLIAFGWDFKVGRGSVPIRL